VPTDNFGSACGDGSMDVFLRDRLSFCVKKIRFLGHYQDVELREFRASFFGATNAKF
jgi:hypothetical protein